MAAVASFKIQEVRALVRRRDREEAQRLLERIAEAVLPIVTKRRFRVRRLHEFFPKNAHLLGMNVNRGATIYIRLRPQHRSSSFLPYEALLETMLHELTHMVHGPHDQAFYNYLDGMKAEMEEMMIRNVVGHGGATSLYDSSIGHYHGIAGFSVIQPSFARDNRIAAMAAAKQKQYETLLGGTKSQRLGGHSGDKQGQPMTPQELRRRARDAAERRCKDSEACTVAENLDATTLHTPEILGIDDGSDNSDEESFTCGRGATRAITVGSSAPRDIIVLDGDDPDHEPRRPPTPRPLAIAAVIDLVNNGEEVRNDSVTISNRQTHFPVLPRLQRKRKRTNMAVDAIDLTKE